MSTAGKVLVVFVMLASLAGLFLAGGVAQLAINGSRAIDEATAELAKTQADLEQTRHDVVDLRDQITSAQEELDRQLAVLRSRQVDLEEARSQVVESLTRLQYQLGTVEDTIKAAQTTLEHRNQEHQGEARELAALRSKVQDLSAENGQQMGRLKTLRDQFQTTYHTNLELVHKTQ